MKTPNNFSTKEMFVINRKTLEDAIRIIRTGAVMKKETADLYFLDEVRVYETDTDTFYVGLYGQNDRRS